MTFTSFKPLSLLLLLSFAITVKADDPKKISSEIDFVKIYLKGAEVFRKTSINIPKGTTEVVLKNLSHAIDANSIQVRTSNNVAVLSARVQQDYLRNDLMKTPEVKALTDSIINAGERMEYINTQLELLGEEEEILRSNKTVGGTNNGVTASELAKVLELFRTRMTQISTDRTKLNKQYQKLTEKTELWEAQRAELQGAESKSYGEIVLQLQTDESVSTSIEFSYLVWDAGWNPFYNLKAEDVKKPVQLVYKANVYQASSEEWKQVRLVLSTGTPTSNSNLPVLHVKMLSFEDRRQELNYSQLSNRSYIATNSMPANSNIYEWSMSNKKEEADQDDELNKGYAFRQALDNRVNIQQSEVAVDFDIDIPYNIPSDNKVHLVAIKEYELPAQFEYYTVPKAERAVFLTSLVSDWQSLNLLPGEANLFFKGSFTGRSTINPDPNNDTLRLSFGKDKKILVERKCIQDFTSKKTVGGSKKETIGFEIVLNNTNKEEVSIKVRDQVPLSTNAEIVVDLIEKSSADYNKETGELEWTVTLKPGENKKLKVVYAVSSPKGKTVFGI